MHDDRSDAELVRSILEHLVQQQEQGRDPREEKPLKKNQEEGARAIR